MKKSVTWLKGIAILLIVISHMYTVSGGELIYKFCDDLGRLGVIIFICISGIAYGMNPKRVYEVNNWRDIFYHIYKKVKPLYPLYIIFLILMFGIRLAFKESIKWLLMEFVVSLPLLQSFVPYKTVFAYSLNTPMWYLSMMLILWSGVPLTKKVCEWIKVHKINVMLIYVIIICFTFMLTKLNISSEWKRWLIYINPFMNWIYFSFAYIYANYYSKYSKKKLNMGIMSLMVVYAIKDCFPVDFRVVAFLLPVILIVQALFVYPDDKKFKGIFELLGRISTTIFVTHYSICYVFRKSKLYGIVPFLACLCAIIIFAAIVDTKYVMQTYRGPVIGKKKGQ